MAFTALVFNMAPDIEWKFVNNVVLPGDLISEYPKSNENEDNDRKIKLGPGLKLKDNNVVVYKCGVLRRKDNILWVDADQKRYIPVANDKILGIITRNKGGESYKVDIGCNMQASLPFLAFEGATKKNRPSLNIGDLVYCRLSVANKDMEAEVVCIDKHDKANGMGHLIGGFSFNHSLGLARKLLGQKSHLQLILGKYFAFECAVGLNGRTWLKSHSINHTLMIINAIEASEYMTASQFEQMVRKLCQGNY